MTDKMADYADFLARNNTIQLRTEALLSVLSPDTKAITLWAMEPHVFYAKSELYEQVLHFASADKLPLVSKAVWEYCYGNPSTGCEGSLKSIGTVVQGTTKLITKNDTRHVYAASYAKTDAGRDFGDPTAALGISFVNELIDRGKDTPKSLQRILDYINKPYGASSTRGFLIYRIIKLLVNNPDGEFSRSDFVKQPEFADETAIHCALDSLIESGMIDYHSPQKYVGGKLTKGWAKYFAASELDYETCLKDLKTHYPKVRISGVLRKIVDYVNEHPGEGVNNYELGNILGISNVNAKYVLLSLRAEGHMTSEFKGLLHSSANANEWTHLLWDNLLKPIGRVAETMDPTVKGFRDKLEQYISDPDLLAEHIKVVLDIYSDERKHTGPAPNNILRNALLEILNSENGASVKLRVITDKVKDLRGKRGPITGATLQRYLNALLETDEIEKTGRGMYAAKVGRR